jgi:iron uptake system component EfeO
MTLTRLALPVAAGLLLSGCVSQGSDAESTAVTVESTADACTLSAARAPAGTVTFEVANAGSAVTEFYVYEADGSSVVAEVENIGPGVSRTLVVRLDAGTYVTACKPGQTGEGIRAGFTVD